MNILQKGRKLSNLKILYETDSLVFALKPVGVLSEGASDSMTSLLSEYCGGEVFCVHRLDRAVSGVMVYAKDKKTAAYLSSLIANGSFKKEYLAVVHGKAESGEMVDLLFKDSRTNKSFVVKKERKGVRKAKLEYETLAEKDGLSLVRIKLYTGRSHQIRVQFSSRKLPLYGDGKYGGSDNCDIALFSHRISFDGENTGAVSAVAFPENTCPWDKFSKTLKELKRTADEGMML